MFFGRGYVFFNAREWFLEHSFSKSLFYTIGGFFLLFLANVAFNFISARFLGPVLYGEFNSYFYLLIAFSYPNNSLQLAVAKNVAVSNYEHERNELYSILLMSFFLFIFLLILMPFLLGFYRIRGLFYSIIGAIIVVLWFILSGVRGIFQGKMDFLGYGLNIGLEGFLRAMSALIFFLVGLKVGGAVFSSVIGEAGALFILLISLGKSFLKFKGVGFNFKLFRSFLYACSILLPFGFIFQLDLVFSQHFFNPEVVGYIAACSLYGKNLVLLSMVFANVVFSYVLKKDENFFYLGNFLTVLIFLGAFIFSIFAGRYIILLIQGERFLEAYRYLPIYILSSLPLGIMQQIVNFAFAKGVKSFSYILWILLIILSFAIYNILKNPLTPLQFLWMFFFSFLIIDVFLISIIFLPNMKLLLTKKTK